MLNDKNILSTLTQHMSTLKKYGIKKIGLFGSFVKNEQTADSDIDFLVEFELGKKTFDNYMDLKFYLEDLFQRDIDLVIFDTIKPDLKPHILRSVKYAEGA